MRLRWHVGGHGDKKIPIGEYLPETEADVRLLEEMWAKGELAMPRDEKDYHHVKVAPGQWLWLGDRAGVEAGYTDLTNTLRAIRPEAMGIVPGVFALPRFFGEVIGKDGVNELADQARVLLGDEALLGVLGENARALVTALAVLDIPEAMSDEDKSAPGQGDAAPGGEE